MTLILIVSSHSSWILFVTLFLDTTALSSRLFKILSTTFESSLVKSEKQQATASLQASENNAYRSTRNIHLKTSNINESFANLVIHKSANIVFYTIIVIHYSQGVIRNLFFLKLMNFIWCSYSKILFFFEINKR